MLHEDPHRRRRAPPGLRGRGRRLLVGVLGLLIAASAGGDDDLSELSLEDLLRVRVASHVALELRSQPATVTVIEREQIAATPARTLSELLRTWVPGYFLVEDQDDVIAAFRGLAPDNNSKVLLLLDGHPLNAEWFWGPADAILNGGDLGWIERIEVIRGPGSASLGQGALLGVVNLVPRDTFAAPTALRLEGGDDGHWRVGLSAGGASGDLRHSIWWSEGGYDGQPVRNEGWARDQVAQGLSVHERGHRLHRADRRTVLGRLRSGGWELGALRVEQRRDLYQFYRDREEVEQTLTTLFGRWRREIGVNAAWTARFSLHQDDYALASHEGIVMGGTRENRGDAAGVLNLRRGSHRLALGLQVARFESGRRNHEGNNFLINVEADRLDDVNARHRWAYPHEVTIRSLFAEDYVALGERWELFAALRFDDHSHWGSRLTPRVGVFVDLREDLRLRASWQRGFRGAVGVHYSGGFERDGLLREESFDDVESSPLLVEKGFSNLPPTDPEEIDGLELAAHWEPTERWSVEGVLFRNEVHDVIDVGVFALEDSEVPPEGLVVGEDLIGSWNGFFFFKNNRGSIRQLGAELFLRYRSPRLDVTYSHAAVRADAADADQVRGSMYLAGDPGDPGFKAFPEDVDRLSVLAPLLGDRLKLAVHALRWSSWASPRGERVDGGELVDLSLDWRLAPGWSVDLALRNLFGEDALYPMNNNAGDVARGAGTPALEDTTGWIGVTRRF